MIDALTSCTAFDGPRRLAAGPLAEVARAVKARAEADPAAALLTFDDTTGAVIDLDLRGTPEEVVARLGTSAPAASERRSRGRPRLGVVAREVTLLPRQWEWLARQPGGASAALRRLVDAARRDDSPGVARAAREAAYRFMAAMAGDLPGFEEATRALFAGDRARFEAQAAAWPADIRAHAETLAWPATG